MKTTSSTAMLVRRITAFCFGLALMIALLVLLSPKPADAATTFIVNKTGDAGDRKIDGVCDSSRKRGKQCTLRAAIQETNATPGGNTIDFNIGGTAGVKTIKPAKPLPTITDPVTIDGYTQPGASENALSEGNDAVLLIQLNGTNAGAITNGLTITASGSIVRGLVINRFGGDGIAMEGTGATDNIVEGNFIGTDAAGTADLGNGDDGVHIFGADDNTVGGTAARARNVISGNDEGVVILNDSTGNVILGNFIGTDKNGAADLGNSASGVGIGFASDNTVGGVVSGARNVISGNERVGVAISASSSNGNEVLGNFIGTDVSGTANLGNGDDGADIFNGDGVQIFNAPDNTVGGTAAGAGNRIADSEGDGVLVFGSAAVGNRILSNSIFSNGELGIDLGAEDVTANDTDDPDTGANNNLQNFPEDLSARRSSSTGITTISGTLNSNPNQSFIIQCFIAAPDPSAHGEGQLPVAQTTATTDANGDASFACVSPIPQAGQLVTATATNTASGDTSEFSQNVGVVAGS